MTGVEAAEWGLRQTGKPLHYRELTRLILEQGLWQTEGKTPEATISAGLGVDIRRLRSESRFQQTGKGVFALREWGLSEFTPKRRGEIPVEAARDRSPDSESARAMSFTDAAEKVLGEFGNKEPMHYRDITTKVLELGLVDTAGKTPEATLYAMILAESHRQARRGDTPRFVKHGRGYVGLTRWMGRGLAFQIDQHNKEVRKRLHDRVRKTGPAEFEELIGRLLVAIGFEEVSVTTRTNDGGVDVRGTLVVGEVIRTRMAVQAKRWKANNVQAPTVQQVRGSLGAHEQGLIITTSDFSKGARTEAERSDATPVALMNGDQLVKLLIESGIGVQRKSYDLLDLGEDEDLATASDAEDPI